MRDTPAYAFAPPLVPRWKVVTPPASALPVPLNDVKVFINRPIEDTFWDAETTQLITTAATAIEHYCKITLQETVFEAAVPRWFANIRLDKRPFQQVESIKYVAAGTGEITDVDDELWHAQEIPQQCGMVFLGEGLEWPEAARRTDAIRIQVKAGFASGEIPGEIIHALMMTVAALDRTRGDEQAKQSSNVTVYAMKQSRGGSIIPVEAKAMLAPHTLRFV